MPKRLTLKSETLSALTADDLTTVVGGVVKTLNVRECVPSFNVHTCIDCLTRICE